jgi:pyridinium-3,5-biscarboxylic acid mononucleotide sulfurtransferase
MARIEVGKTEIKEMFDTDKLSVIDSKLKELGFTHIVLDLSGYKSNENINVHSFKKKIT